ncbi:MAG: hypothetical protein QOJ19_208, partial [Acidimicrobiia bacterium]|nr:hypothetical protein [Acidimicrobiia bacterium]
MTDSTVVSPARGIAGERYHAVRSSLAALSDLDLARLSAQAANRLGPLGTGGASGLRRALDPRPEVMDPASWAAIEAGVTERIALLEALAHDVYGPQLTLARGLLPAEAVWSSSLLTRAAMGRPPLGGRWLVHAAIDIGMLASGGPIALGAETASLAGLGLAYQNRLTTAELLPGPFTRARIRRLLPFLDRLRAALAGLARSGTGRGRVVILSPPRTDPAHDDVALLARTLGYTLVEGADLTVRRGAVRVRSLGGLEPVDVVLRLMPDAQCDPLELDARSRAGTPGLVVAAWRGEVALANPIGAEWLSSPALAAFLPRLCRALLGTEPALAGPAAWWCGDETGRARARAALDDLILLPFDGGPSIETRFLDASGQHDLVDRLDTDGPNWVAMARPELASSGSWVDGAVRLLPSVVRTFAVVDRAGTAVAPGGLASVLVDESPKVWELASGAPTRDTWVLSTGAPGDDARVRVALPQVDLSDSLPSRAGESLYWLGRHAERAEAVVRLAQTVAELAPDGGEAGDGPAWPSWLGTALDRLTGVFDSAPALTRDLGSVAARALTEADRPLGLP